MKKTINKSRKNSSSKNSKILAAAEMLPDKKAENGCGRAAEAPAKRLGVSVSTIYKAKSVLKNASKENLQDIKDGKVSIKKIYNETKPVSPLKKAVDVLEKSNFRVLKIEEVFADSDDSKVALNLQIVPKDI